jgi:hypothetical protein
MSTELESRRDGVVDLATILPNGDRPYHATCAFDDLVVARAPG